MRPFPLLLVGMFVLAIDGNTIERSIHDTLLDAAVRITVEQPEVIESWVRDRMYLDPNKIKLTSKGAFLQKCESSICIPKFAWDDHGLFIQCSREEAKEHYDKAWEAFRDAIGHSLGAGAAFAAEQPLIGVYEGYRSVEKWKEFGREYRAGSEADGGGIGTVLDGPDRDK